jgi:hypothetical protein
MKPKILFSITAILSFINGFFYLVLPVFSLPLLGQPVSEAIVMNTRIFGACAIGLSVITWLAKDSRDPQILRMVAIGNLVTLGLLVFVDAQGILRGAINWVGWLFFLADLILSVGFILLLVRKELS